MIKKDDNSFFKEEISSAYFPSRRRPSKSGFRYSTAAVDNAAVKQNNSQQREWKLQAWGYENAERWDDGTSKRKEVSGKHNGEAMLLLICLLQVFLIVVFSQRSWLAKIFLFDGSQQLHMNVEILRPNSSATVTPADNPQKGANGLEQQELRTDSAETGIASSNVQVPTAEVKNLLQRFDKLLRINSEEAGEVKDQDSGRFRDVQLFFVQVEDDGQLQLRSVLHTVPFDQAPLSRTMAELLKGPSPQEINKGLHSMLPPEMQIVSIRVLGNTVFINFSEDFYQMSQLTAVLLAGVKQLVFTVTEYPNIKALRILVEGQPIFPKNLPQNIAKELEQLGINLNSELQREDLWKGEIGKFAIER